MPAASVRFSADNEEFSGYIWALSYNASMRQTEVGFLK
jgi:hypothetical protein